MLGLEVVAVVPFFVAAWKLSQKVNEQRALIEQHESLITQQQEVLQTLTGGGSGTSVVSSKTLAVVSVLVAATVTARYTYQATQIRRNVPPPPNYEPRPAVFDAEECIICMANSKDTFFSPCQHFSTCWPCSQKLLNKQCPTCRQKIEFTQFLYVS
ncbi:hypothetical protein STCU_03345 [Strigomonas culicis]|uniref:RING-type domain-containing protein n=1 Tax=Strigomonas culicis TaxID=28005 RepID=S9URY2_9TRYP|nr:hypothetical protein STCU_03345 [Strigomonas culicis]|eukprot:EPY31658.1 hypothetical protein STCU_03345 [Strigomonas culicis]